MRTINQIIIHCTATKAGRKTTVEEIDRWHRARGFRCIGYHYVIYLDGTVARDAMIRKPEPTARATTPILLECAM